MPPYQVAVMPQFNPFMPSGLSYLNSLGRSFSNRRDVWLVFIATISFIEISVFNASSLDPEQALHSGCQCSFY